MKPDARHDRLADPEADRGGGGDADGRRDGRDFPAPRVRRRRWTTLLIWLVPVAAAVMLGFYFRHYLADRGPSVVVRVAEAAMLQPGDTPVRCRGVEIGRVASVALADDESGADVTVQLRRDAAGFARAGAAYWLVAPDLSGGSLRGLGTVLSGPYLEARSGGGDVRDRFAALDAPPAASRRGLSIRLLSRDVRRANRGTPVLYRGVQVGAIESVALARDATHVVLRATIEPNYAALVRADSRFWSEPPADIKGGLFSGIEVELGTLKQLLAGSVHFASPDDPVARPAMDSDRFVLHEEPQEAWAKWTPQIEVEPAPSPSASDVPAAGEGEMP